MKHHKISISGLDQKRLNRVINRIEHFTKSRKCLDGTFKRNGLVIAVQAEHNIYSA